MNEVGSGGTEFWKQEKTEFDDIQQTRDIFDVLPNPTRGSYGYMDINYGYKF